MAEQPSFLIDVSSLSFEWQNEMYCSTPNQEAIPTAQTNDISNLTKVIFMLKAVEMKL
jgi:hypothetical protein